MKNQLSHKKRRQRANSEAKPNKLSQKQEEKPAVTEIKNSKETTFLDVDTSELTKSKKMVHYENLMWVAESKGNHLEAERWRIKVDQVSKQQSGYTETALNMVKKDDIDEIKKEFDEKCDKLIKSFSKKIHEFNETSISKLQTLRNQQRQDLCQLKLHLSKTYNAPSVNKELKELREIEYFLGKRKMFVEAYNIQQQIKQLEDQVAKQYYRKKQRQNQEEITKLQNEHKEALQRTMKKLESEKTKLHIQFQNELNILHTWNQHQVQKIESQHTKDLEKLNKKILTFTDSKKMAQVAMKQQFLRDQDMDIDADFAQQATEQFPTFAANIDDKSANIPLFPTKNANKYSDHKFTNPLRLAARKENFTQPKPITTFVLRSSVGLRDRNKFYEHKNAAKVQTLGVEGEVDRQYKVVCDQFMFGFDKKLVSRPSTVDLTIDPDTQTIRWSKHATNSISGKIKKKEPIRSKRESVLACSIPFKDVEKVIRASTEPAFSSRVVKNKNNCVSIIGKHSSLHVELPQEKDVNILIDAMQSRS